MKATASAPHTSALYTHKAHNVPTTVALTCQQLSSNLVISSWTQLFSLGFIAHDFNLLTSSLLFVFLFVKFCHWEKICAVFNNMSWKEFKELIREKLFVGWKDSYLKNKDTENKGEFKIGAPPIRHNAFR